VYVDCVQSQAEILYETTESMTTMEEEGVEEGTGGGGGNRDQFKKEGDQKSNKKTDETVG